MSGSPTTPSRSRAGSSSRPPATFPKRISWLRAELTTRLRLRRCRDLRWSQRGQMWFPREQTQNAPKPTGTGKGHFASGRDKRSAEAARDVVLGGLLVRVGEDLLSVVDLDESAGLSGRLEVEERRLIAHAGSLLHVVRDDDDCEVQLEFRDQVLDRQRGDRVERRAGLVHEKYVG